MDRKIKSFYTECDKIFIEMDDNSKLKFRGTDENIKNIDKMLKNQANDRIEEIDRELLETLPVTGVDAAVCLTGFLGIGGSVFCSIYGLGAMFAHNNQDNIGTILFSVAGGCAGVAVISKLILYAKEKRHFKKKQKLRDEKEKLEFINDNGKVLRSFPKYSNSLAGLNSDQSNHIKFCGLPFTVLDVNKFKIEDLERIVDNIRIEKEISADTLNKQEQKVKSMK